MINIVAIIHISFSYRTSKNPSSLLWNHHSN